LWYILFWDSTYPTNTITFLVFTRTVITGTKLFHRNEETVQELKF
jgi:hypothetical protein